jgi:hypothetical protein
MELGHLSCTENMVHVSGFERQEFGVMDLDFMFMIESVLHLCQLVKLSKMDMPVVLSLSGLNRMAVWPVQTQPHSLRMLYTPEVTCHQFKEPGGLCVADKHIQSCVLMS